MHLCSRHRKTNKSYLSDSCKKFRNRTGRHQTAAESFSKQELQPISTTQTPLFLCQTRREEVAKVQKLCYCSGGMKRRKVREHKLWSRKDQAQFRSELLFHCTLLLSLKPTYLTTRQSHILSTKP